MEDHPHSCQYPCQYADVEGDRVDNPVNKGVKTNSQHWDNTHGVVCILIFVTDIRLQEAIEQINGQKARQQGYGSRAAHIERFGYDVHE